MNNQEITKKKSFKEYYANEDYKLKHQNYMKETVICDCGCTYLRYNASHHKKTKKHLLIINLLAQRDILGRNEVPLNINNF